MGVVTDIRIRDLEAELYQLKSAWIDPIAHDQVKKDLLQMTEAKETYQVREDIADKSYLFLCIDYLEQIVCLVPGISLKQESAFT